MQVTPDFSQVITPEPGPPKKMLTVTKNGPQCIVEINSSSLGTLLTCMRKSYYELVKGYRKASPAQIFGSAIHKALEVFYSHPSAERSFPPNFRECSDLMAHGNPAPSTHFLYLAIQAFVRAASPLQSLPDSDKRSISNGVWILQEYFKTYLTDPYVVMSDGKGPIVERTCEMVLSETPQLKIILFGTIDVVLRHELNGTILPADHKTASQLGSDFYNRCKPNAQYTGYVLLAKHCLGISSDSFLVNALQVKPRPKTARGTDPNFARQVTSRTDEDFAEFREQVTYAVENYLNCVDTQKWPFGHVDACAQWGGCGFLQVCSAPKSLRQNLIESKFGVQ